MFSYLFTFRSQTAAPCAAGGVEPRLHVGRLCGGGRRRARRTAPARMEQPRFRRLPRPSERLSGAGAAMIYLDAGATTLQKPPAVALAVQSAMCRMATPGRGGSMTAAVWQGRCLTRSRSRSYSL